MPSKRLSTAPAADYYIGFDVAKRKLDWSVIDHRGIEQTYGVVPNEAEAIATLLLTITGHYSGTLMYTSVEATGTYHELLAHTSEAVGLRCVLYNPILTKQQIRGTVRGRKTDRTDAFLVARVAWSGEGEFYVCDRYPTTRHLARSCRKLTVLNNAFRLYHAHLSAQVGEVSSPGTTEQLHGIQAAIISAKKAVAKDLAVSAQSPEFTLLQTIPGVGPLLAACILGEVQDVRRFSSAKHLTSFAGLDPRIRQSGHTLNNTGKITKRGSNDLRRGLFLAATVARRFDPQFKAFYEKKRREGKGYTVTVCATARKLTETIYAVWSKGKPYEVPEVFRYAQPLEHAEKIALAD